MLESESLEFRVINFFKNFKAFSKLKNDDIKKFDFVNSGYFDSAQLIEMILEMEATFKIEFNQQDLQSSRMKSVAGLIELIKDRQVVTHNN